MVRELDTDQLERLLEARHRVRIKFIVTMGVILVVGVFLVVGNVPLLTAPCALAGLAIGRVLMGPYRQVLAELGLGEYEALRILEEERDRRTGRDLLPPEVRARRAGRAYLAFLYGGLAAVPVLVAAAIYAFSQGNKTVDENAPPDPWFAVSVFGGVLALILIVTLFSLARRQHRRAAGWEKEVRARLSDQEGLRRGPAGA